MVVLNELTLQAGGLGKCAGVKAFEEKPALIAEHLGLENEYTRQLSLDCLHAYSSASLSKYWP